MPESAQFCPQCGYQIGQALSQTSLSQSPSLSRAPSIWMAVTSLALSIFTFLVLAATASDLDTLSALSKLESAFGSHTLKKQFAEDVMNSAVGGIVLGLPAVVFGSISLVQQRAGRGMAIAGLVICGIDLLLILGLFGLTVK